MDREGIYKEANEINEKYHYLVETLDEKYNYQAQYESDDVITISVKDAILMKGVESRASSQILNGYKAKFDATVIQNTKRYFVGKNKPIFIGKTIHDEFGFGGYNVNVGPDKKVPLNPHDPERSCGGSSGGCAGFTARTKYRHISIAESTGGSISTPASFCGVVGLTPTYGMISRNGLISYANSLDKIGIMAKNVTDCAIGLEMIDSVDDKDPTNADHEIKKYKQLLNDDEVFRKKTIQNNTINIGLINLDEDNAANDNVKVRVEKIKKKLEQLGFSVNTFKADMSFINKFSLPVYYILSLSEASTNLAQLCGLRYGVSSIPTELTYNDYFTKIRSENFSDEAKRRIILGTFARMAAYRDAYMNKAMKVRRLIVNEYSKLFDKFDFLIGPSTPTIAPKLSEIENITPFEEMKADEFCCSPNLAGLPHISLPSGKSYDMPTGMMIIANHFEEDKLLWLAKKNED